MTMENKKEEKPEQEVSNLKGDYRNVAVLLFLYFLQGAIAFELTNLVSDDKSNFILQAFLSEFQWQCLFFYKTVACHMQSRLDSLLHFIHLHVSCDV